MKNDYPAIRNILGSIFSVDVGLSEDEESSMFDRALINEEYREQLREELRRALSDTQLSWMELLENDRYEVYPADSEDDAKSYAIDIFWDKLFPGEELPS